MGGFWLAVGPLRFVPTTMKESGHAILTESPSQQKGSGMMKITSLPTPIKTKVQLATRKSRVHSHVDTDDHGCGTATKDGKTKEVVSKANRSQEKGTPWWMRSKERAVGFC